MRKKMVVEKLKCSADNRGFVFEPLGAENLMSMKNTHVAVTKPGEVRGNHYHQRQSEDMAVCGPALVRVREDGVTRDLEVPDGEIHRFHFPTGVSHAVVGTGSGPGLLIAFTDQLFDPETPDSIKDELIRPGSS